MSGPPAVTVASCVATAVACGGTAWAVARGAPREVFLGLLAVHLVQGALPEAAPDGGRNDLPVELPAG